MRKFGLTMLAVAFLASVAVATDKVPAGKAQQMTGYVSDEKCGADGVNMTACIKKCEAEGKKLVFVSDKGHEVLKVSNQEVLKGHEGQHISVMAQQANGALHVTKVEALK
jgi:hypothetical protein